MRDDVFLSFVTDQAAAEMALDPEGTWPNDEHDRALAAMMFKDDAARAAWLRWKTRYPSVLQRLKQELG